MRDQHSCNSEAGAILQRLRDTYSPPVSLRGHQREDWLRAHMTKDDYASLTEVRNALVVGNFGFVVQQVRKTPSAFSPDVDIEDIISGAQLALMYRTWDWDVTKGAWTTWAAAIIRKGATEASDAFSAFERRLHRENISEAVRLERLMPQASFADRAKESSLPHFRTSPNAIREWTAVAHGWTGRIEMDAPPPWPDDDGSAPGSRGEAIPDPRNSRAPEDENVMANLLIEILGHEDATLVSLHLGLDGHKPLDAKEVAIHFAETFGTPVLPTAVVRSRLSDALAALSAKGDEVQRVLFPEG